MEGLAAAGGVIAVVSLAGQVTQGCNYLHTVFEDARDAPIELRLLNNELSIIESISTKFAASIPDHPEHLAALDFCNESIHKLRDVVDEYGILTGVGKYTKWGPRLALALNASKILKHLNRLREAKGHLEHLQNVSKHDETKLKIENLRNSIQQLNSSNSQISAIVNYSHAKVDGIASTAKETRLILQNMADKFVNQTERSLESDHLIEKRVVDAVELILENSLKKHFRETIDLQSSSSIRSPHLEACHHMPPSNLKSWNPSLENPSIISQKSELECILAELSGEIQTVECPDFERTSKYSTRIGQVLVRTVSKTYITLDEIEMENIQFNPSPMLNAQELSSVDEFPITITRTEILLLPGSWEQARGATIKLYDMASPSIINSTLTLQMRSFSDSRSQLPKYLDKRVAAVNVLDNKFTVSQPTGVKVTASPFLLYTAFRTVFVAQQVRHGKARPRKYRKPRHSTSLLRQSPDSEVNDVLELITLWIESGLSLEYQDIFMSEPDRTGKTQESIFRQGFNRLSIIQRLRHEYVHELVMETHNAYDAGNYQTLHSLHRVHAKYGARYSAIASPAPVNIFGYKFILESLDSEVHGNEECSSWQMVPIRYRKIAFHFLIILSDLNMLEWELSEVIPYTSQDFIISRFEELSNVLGNMRDFLYRFLFPMVQGGGFNPSKFQDDLQELLKYQCRMRVDGMTSIFSRLDSSCEVSVDRYIIDSLYLMTQTPLRAASCFWVLRPISTDRPSTRVIGNQIWNLTAHER
ncbi:hypothetical protein BCON_0150g00130 [Botryotinia convoluta]|uniref:Fungal N-terminal domain-containing protein n=1 Tax=Botryotinia convoluta TaxID=54673 RepID=A0A4Z1HSW3_9HELO|nr:hypothetical protein BCON_0150g00130 [Botryotinia convoluta]